MQRIVAVTALLFLSLAEPALAKPKLALIIDDLGYDMMPREIAALPSEISVSVIPFTEFDTAVTLSALSQQREVLLHLPMQSPDGTPQEPNSLTLNMSKEEMQARVKEALYRVPQVVAVNNHMGSLLTQHQEPMHWLMELLESREIGFIDSRTTQVPWRNAWRKNTALPTIVVMCFSIISPMKRLSSANSSLRFNKRRNVAQPW
nr:divergent polysaccharide deacetylase family protein [Enterovibrio coralii]